MRRISGKVPRSRKVCHQLHGVQNNAPMKMPWYGPRTVGSLQSRSGSEPSKALLSVPVERRDMYTGVPKAK